MQKPRTKHVTDIGSDVLLQFFNEKFVVFLEEEVSLRKIQIAIFAGQIQSYFILWNTTSSTWLYLLHASILISKLLSSTFLARFMVKLKVLPVSSTTSLINFSTEGLHVAQEGWCVRPSPFSLEIIRQIFWVMVGWPFPSLPLHPHGVATRHQFATGWTENKHPAKTWV